MLVSIGARIDDLLVIIQHIRPHNIMFTILYSNSLHAPISYNALFSGKKIFYNLD